METITRTVYDSLGRVSSTWMGTDDSPSSGDWTPTNNSSPANMLQVAAYQYDGGNVGDGTLTLATQNVDSTSGDDRVTQSWYDWRDRRIATKNGVASSESDGTHRPIVFRTLDNLDRVTELDVYDGDGTASTVSSGAVSAPSSGLLRKKTVTTFDDRNRVTEIQVYSVDQSSGSVSSNALTTTYDYNGADNLYLAAQPGVFVRNRLFDGLRRVTEEVDSDGGLASGSDQTEFSETYFTYDADGNVILQKKMEHFHDDTETDSLNAPGDGTPQARVTFLAWYYDAANRLTDSVDVGTNGDVSDGSYSGPSSAPSRSDTVMRTSYTYNSAGWTDTITDPEGLITAKYYDMLGRVNRQIEAYDGAIPPSPGSLPMETGSTDRRRRSGHMTAWMMC